MKRRFPDIFLSEDSGPSCSWPMGMLSIPIPLLGSDDVSVWRTPRYMTEQQWAQMMATLDTMRPALTEHKP